MTYAKLIREQVQKKTGDKKMGNEYKLYKDDEFGKLSIYEMSNKLAFDFDSGNLYGVSVSDLMTPKEMAKIMLEGLTVCSYWMDIDELKELIEHHMYHKVY